MTLDTAKALRVMLNPITQVLDKLSESLPAQELLPLRQTCTLWNSSFILVLRRKHEPIRFNLVPGESDYVLSRDPSRIYKDTADLPKFVQLMESIGSASPFRKYKVRSVRPLPGFLTRYGPTITSLELRWYDEDKWTLETVHENEFEDVDRADMESWFMGLLKRDVGSKGNEMLDDTGHLKLADLCLPKLKQLTFKYAGYEQPARYDRVVLDLLLAAPPSSLEM